MRGKYDGILTERPICENRCTTAVLTRLSENCRSFGQWVRAAISPDRHWIAIPTSKLCAVCRLVHILRFARRERDGPTGCGVIRPGLTPTATRGSTAELVVV